MAQTSTVPPAVRLAYEEFLTQYDGTHAEWQDGEVIIMSPVSRRHQDIGAFFLLLLGFYVEYKSLGKILYSQFQMHLRTQKTGREPDILFVATQNLARMQPNYLDGPADIAIEIISPESIRRDRDTKFREYQQAGVGEYWLIDPLIQTANFYQLNAEGCCQDTPPDAEGRYVCRALPGLWIAPGRLWQTPLPPTLGVLKLWGLVS